MPRANGKAWLLAWFCLAVLSPAQAGPGPVSNDVRTLSAPADTVVTGYYGVSGRLAFTQSASDSFKATIQVAVAPKTPSGNYTLSFGKFVNPSITTIRVDRDLGVVDASGPNLVSWNKGGVVCIYENLGANKWVAFLGGLPPNVTCSEYWHMFDFKLLELRRVVLEFFGVLFWRYSLNNQELYEPQVREAVHSFTIGPIRLEQDDKQNPNQGQGGGTDCGMASHAFTSLRAGLMIEDAPLLTVPPWARGWLPV